METIRISKRLQAVAALVTDGSRLADIGTDHAYVPIYLCRLDRIPQAIAMDINPGPIGRAKEHIALNGLEQRIQTRLSDGAAALLKDEADCILIAGMGGGLILHILEKGKEVFTAAKEVILQPQSKVREVRLFLERQGFVTDKEDMVLEDGKYYPMMRVHYAPAEHIVSEEVFLRYGERLLLERHPVLYSYLQKEKERYTDILSKMQDGQESGRISERRTEVSEQLWYNQKALRYWEGNGGKQDEERNNYP